MDTFTIVLISVKEITRGASLAVDFDVCGKGKDVISNNNVPSNNSLPYFQQLDPAL